MSTVITQAFIYLVILAVGYIFKRAGIFKTQDTVFLKNVILYLTMPATAVYGLSDLILKPSMLWSFIIGMVSCAALLAASLTITRKKSRREKLTWLFSANSFNIANFAIPFLAGLISTDAFAALCLFDVAMSISLYGIDCTVANRINEKDAEGAQNRLPKTSAVKDLFKKIFSSPMTDAYLIMILLAAVSVRLPATIIKLASVTANANSFLVMLSIGILFEFDLDQKSAKVLNKFFSVRYAVAAVAAVIVYFVIPVTADIRQALCVILMSPVASIAPLLTKDSGGDAVTAAQINSISIILGILMMVVVYGLT